MRELGHTVDPIPDEEIAKMVEEAKNQPKELPYRFLFSKRMLPRTIVAGYLNVSVISTSGQYTGQDCEVELYEGDVVALLADADPSNDPEPIKTSQIVVGQRTTFNGMNFGTYTMNVKLLDEQAAAQVSISPRTTTMWGIDNRQTYEIA